MTPNPKGKHTQWKTRPSFQSRLTIYKDIGNRPVVCTLIHSERINAADLNKILAAERLADALATLRREAKQIQPHLANQLTIDQPNRDRLADAIEEAEAALIAAGIQS